MVVFTNLLSKEVIYIFHRDSRIIYTKLIESTSKIIQQRLELAKIQQKEIEIITIKINGKEKKNHEEVNKILHELYENIVKNQKSKIIDTTATEIKPPISKPKITEIHE